MNIYMDNAATTPVKPEVLEVVINTMTDIWANPSSVYEDGLVAKRLIENARNIIADSINANADEIYFTSGASESNAMCIQGFKQANDHAFIISSNIEHSSISMMNIPEQVKVRHDGLIHIEDLERVLQDHNYNWLSTLVTIQGANNEIGTIQNIKGIADVTHKYNGIFHSDLTQLYPYHKIDVKSIGIDMASVSCHKFGCPKGIGFAYIRKGIKISPIIFGHQENQLRGGTYNTPLICAAGKGVELLQYNFDIMRNQRNYLWDRIQEMCTKNNVKVILNGDFNKRLPNNINCYIEGINSQDFIALADLYGFDLSAGSACNAGSSEPSSVLMALGLTNDQAKSSIRITISEDTSNEDIDKFMKVLQMIITQFCK